MLNYFTVVGRLVEAPKENEGKVEIKVSVPRSYKNEEGIYETDIIEITLMGLIANKTIEYIKKGDLVGVKGRIENMKLVAEKISFLSSNKETLKENGAM